MTEKKEPECSFCGRLQSQCLTLVSGPSVYICDECVNMAYETCARKFREHRESFNAYMRGVFDTLRAGGNMDEGGQVKSENDSQKDE